MPKYGIFSLEEVKRTCSNCGQELEEIEGNYHGGFIYERVFLCINPECVGECVGDKYAKQ